MVALPMRLLLGAAIARRNLREPITFQLLDYENHKVGAQHAVSENFLPWGGNFRFKS